MKIIETYIDASALVPVAGLSSYGEHVRIDLTEEWLLDHRVCKPLQKVCELTFGSV